MITMKQNYSLKLLITVITILFAFETYADRNKNIVKFSADSLEYRIENTKKIFKEKIIYSKTIHDALNGSNCAVIMTAWNQYKTLTDKDLKGMKKRVLIDTRRIFNKSKFKAEYYSIGNG